MRVKRSAPVLTAVIAFLAYLLTIEPDLTWVNFGGDGGELITAAVTFGVPHPPGYPVYVLLGNLFGRLPLGTVAFRFNFLSAVGIAVAAGFVTGIVLDLLSVHLASNDHRVKVLGRDGDRKWVAAVSAGLAFAFGSLVWSQAIIAEVYGLNLAFVAAFLYFFLTRFAKSRYSQRSAVFIGLLLGLSITTHLTSLFLLPLALLLTPLRRWPWLAAGIVAGLLPFLFLPLLAQSGSPIIWSRPDTMEGWWWLVSGQIYRPNVFGLPMSEWPDRLSQWGLPFLEQFVYIGLPLLLAGFFGCFKKNPRLLIGLLLTAVLYGVYAFTYRTFDAAVLFLPGFLLLSVILGFGLYFLGKAAIILPLSLLWLNLGQPEHGYYVNMAAPVRPVAERLLEEVPEQAILITPGDPSIAALWYFHHVEGKRPDILILDGNLFQFEWYRAQLAQDYPFLQHLTRDDLPGFIETNRQFRPVCEVSLVESGYRHC